MMHQSDHVSFDIQDCADVTSAQDFVSLAFQVRAVIGDRKLWYRVSRARCGRSRKRARKSGTEDGHLHLPTRPGNPWR